MIRIFVDLMFMMAGPLEGHEGDTILVLLH